MCFVALGQALDAMCLASASLWHVVCQSPSLSALLALGAVPVASCQATIFAALTSGELLTAVMHAVVQFHFVVAAVCWAPGFAAAATTKPVSCCEPVLCSGKLPTQDSFASPGAFLFK